MCSDTGSGKVCLGAQGDKDRTMLLLIDRQGTRHYVTLTLENFPQYQPQRRAMRDRR
jgi:hypothetical protein